MKFDERYASFALVEVICVAIACLMLIINPASGWHPLIVAGLPFLVRLVWPGAPLRFGASDLLVLGFLATAVVGVWAAYDPESASQKFYLLLGAGLLYYSLSLQPAQNLWPIGLGLGIFGSVVVLLFFSSSSWGAANADLKIISLLGNWWHGSKPVLNAPGTPGLRQLFANQAGGIAAILLPLCTAVSIYYKRNGKTALAGLGFLLCLALAWGLFISSSRAAWAATGVGFAAFGMLNASMGKKLLPARPSVLLLIPIGALLVGTLALYPLASWFSSPEIPLTEAGSFSSRLQIAQQTYYLIADFPFTGGGLGSFPGLYSEYILLIPHFMFSYSHNMYLDIALEQGLGGLFLWGGMIIFSGITLKFALVHLESQNPRRFFATGLYASLIIGLIHGIADDPLYSTAWGLPLLFVIPGLSIAVVAPQPKFLLDLKRVFWYALAGLAIVLGFLLVFARPLSAAWHANLGAVQMARPDLLDWPRGAWRGVGLQPNYQKAEEAFSRALVADADQRTANFRVGLILVSQQKFSEAAHHLEKAYQITPEHRGIRKSLGYSYAWLGRFDEAARLLAQIPEAQAEMDIYAWWWQTQGRSDLAEKAAAMLKLLGQ